MSASPAGRHIEHYPNCKVHCNTRPSCYCLQRKTQNAGAITTGRTTTNRTCAYKTTGRAKTHKYRKRNKQEARFTIRRLKKLVLSLVKNRSKILSFDATHGNYAVTTFNNMRGEIIQTRPCSPLQLLFSFRISVEVKRWLKMLPFVWALPASSQSLAHTLGVCNWIMTSIAQILTEGKWTFSGLKVRWSSLAAALLLLCSSKHGEQRAADFSWSCF